MSMVCREIAQEDDALDFGKDYQASGGSDEKKMQVSFRMCGD